MREQVQKTLFDLVEKSSYFSLCLDESTDNTNVNQLLIFICITQEDFSSKEEFFDVCALHGRKKGKDIYDAVLRNSVDKIGGFDRCTVGRKKNETPLFISKQVILQK